jgi:hypothetical protein
MAVTMAVLAARATNLVALDSVQDACRSTPASSQMSDSVLQIDHKLLDAHLSCGMWGCLTVV